VQNINPGMLAAQHQQSIETTAEDIKKEVAQHLSEIPENVEEKLDLDSLDKTLQALKSGHDVLAEGLDRVDDITNS